MKKRIFNHFLFDYDNTTGKSEAPAFRACCSLVNEVLADYDVDEQFTPAELLEKFVGKSFRQMILDLSAEHSFKVSGDELERLVLEEEDRVITRLEKELEECDGVRGVLDWAKDIYTCSVVSSSAMRRLLACVRKAAQEGYFGDRIFSASSSLPTPQSKPNPAIYIHAMQVLGATADECLAIEDSGSGVRAAVAAGITVVAYVGAYETCEEQDAMARKLTELGAVTVMYHWDEFAAIVAGFEQGTLSPAVVS
jgi:beta-phosphoglucomutase-like phosphatase (HAD superfamily)